MISEPDRRDAFLTHLSGCETRLRAFIAGALAAVDERADFFQEVVLILWRKYDQFDASRSFLPWAMGVAVRRMKVEYRWSKRRPGLLAADHLERLALALESASEDAPSLEEEALAACLAALPPKSAGLMQRRYFDQQSIEALGAENGLSAAAVYQTLSRIRRALADCIRQRLRPSGKDAPSTAGPAHSLFNSAPVDARPAGNFTSNRHENRS